MSKYKCPECGNTASFELATEGFLFHRWREINGNGETIGDEYGEYENDSQFLSCSKCGYEADIEEFETGGDGNDKKETA